MIVTITAIRYQFGADLSKEEKTKLAEELLRGLAVGTDIILKAEPDNVADKKAVAAYLGYTRRIGYVSGEQLVAVHPLLDEYGELDAKVSGNDGHVTLFVEVEGEKTNAAGSEKSSVCQSLPFDASVLLPFTDEERSLEVVAHRWLALEVKKENAKRLLDMARCAVPLLGLTISHDDVLMLRNAHEHLQLMMAAEDMWSEVEKKELEGLTLKVQDLVGDFHTNDVRESVFSIHLEKVRKLAETTLNRKYDDFYFCCDMGIADQVQLEAEHKRLMAWLDALPDGVMHGSEKGLPCRLYYLRLSRRELYDVLGAMITLERLEKRLEIMKRDWWNDEKKIGKVVKELSSCCYGDEVYARAFLFKIKDMRPTEITREVNIGVAARKISFGSRNKPLYDVLNKYDLYTKGLANWNSQISNKEPK